MKKILLTLLFALFTISARAEVSLSFFYDSLQDDGDWFEADGYGYCWQPHDVPSDWSPYTDGYWTYTDAGWTWVSYESFGWATYHYGRWADLRGRGWVWVPGYEWGPAWVSWRSNDSYIGWAPLPARAVVRVGVSIGRDVDYDYDIGPSNYRFTSCNDFGSPSLRPVIVDRSRNITIINQTTNITNITYQNNIVYNGGPDYDRVNRNSHRPIERLQLDRITRVDNSRDNRYAHRENGRLAVVAPPVVPVEERIRPRNIKASLGKVETDNGWSGVRDQKLAERTREKIRDENKNHTRGPVNRGESVQQALRQEARQKPVASVAPQPAVVRPVKRPDANSRDAKPATDKRPQVATENKNRPQTRENTDRREPAATPANREVTTPRQPAKSDRNDAEIAHQREAAARRQQAANSERQNAERQQQASRQREAAAATDKREQQVNRQREAQRENQRSQAANESRQAEQNAARQQAARQANQRAEQAQAQQENRARAQRQEAAQQQREVQQRREQVQAREAQQNRRESAPQPRSEPRQQARPQVQQTRERSQPSSDEQRNERDKKKKKDDRDDGR